MNALASSALIEITTTVSDLVDAERIATTLVEQQLAACVQIAGPITSVYRWQGVVQRDQEFRCTIKTLRPMADRVCETIRQLHPYQVPEILILDVASGNPDYERWLCESVQE